MTLGAKSRFDKAAETLGLDAATRDKAWRRIADLQLAPDDPTVIFLALAGVLEKAATDVPHAIESLPARVEAAVRLATQATPNTPPAEKSRRPAGFLALFVVLFAAIMVAGAGLAIGYGLGRADGAGIERRWQALSLRADAADWQGLIAANADLSKTLREHCGFGGKAAYIVHGERACAVPLWLQGAPAPTSGAVATGWGSIVRLTSEYSAAIEIAGGVMFGLFLRKALSTIGARSPVRWLLDL